MTSSRSLLSYRVPRGIQNPGHRNAEEYWGQERKKQCEHREQELRGCWVVVRTQSGVGENDCRAANAVTAGWAVVKAEIPEVWVSGVCAPCIQGQWRCECIYGYALCFAANTTVSGAPPAKEEIHWFFGPCWRLEVWQRLGFVQLKQKANSKDTCGSHHPKAWRTEFGVQDEMGDMSP